MAVSPAFRDLEPDEPARELEKFVASATLRIGRGAGLERFIATDGKRGSRISRSIQTAALRAQMMRALEAGLVVGSSKLGEEYRAKYESLLRGLPEDEREAELQWDLAHSVEAPSPDTNL